MPAQLLGAHMPTGKGLAFAAHEAKRIGATTMQVFTKSPQMWRAKPVDPAAATAFRQAVSETGLTNIVCHDSYLINLAAADPENREKSANALIEEFERCALYGIPFVNSHMGSHVGQGEELGLAHIIEATKRVLAETDPGITLLMETTAGQGSSLGCKFEMLAAVLEGLKGHSRLAVCVDTCHIFAAGYDIRTAETFLATFTEFEKIVGFDRLKAVHCNDSKQPFESRKDRHESLGEGQIGIEAFRCLVNDSRFESIPIVLETPTENDGHERDLAKLKSLRIAP